MPQVVPYIVYYLAGAAGATAGWAFFAAVVASVVVTAYEQDQARAAAHDAFNSSLKDRLVMTATTDRSRSIVYGRARNVDGVLFKATHGVNKEFYTLVVAVTGFECDGIEDVYFNDILVEIDDDGYVQTAPFLRVDKVTYSEFVTVSGGTGTVTLAKTPVPSTVSATSTVSPNDPDFPGTASGISVVGNVVTVTAADGQWALAYQSAEGVSHARVRKYLGAPDQDISPELFQLVPGLIVPGRHRFAGIPLLLVTLLFNSDAFPSGVPNVSAVVRGVRVFDPRTGQTSWYNVESPNTNLPNPGENPALCALDWARQLHGGALQLSETVVDSFVGAANACDVITDFNTLTQETWTGIASEGGDFTVPPNTQIRYGSDDRWTTLLASGLGHCTVAFFGSDPAEGTLKTCQSFVAPVPIMITEARYKCGIVARTDNAADGVFGDLVQAMAGAYGWSGGLLRVRAGAWSLPLATHITEDWVADTGAINVNPGTATPDTFNIVTASISDASQDYVAVPLTEIRAQPYIDEDGEELPITMQMNAVTQSWHAQDIAEVLMLESRQAVSMQLPCKLHAFLLDLFDIVPVDLSVYGFVSKNFEVRGWSFTMTGGVVLTLREAAATSYDPATEFTLNDLADNTTLPTPWIVELVQGLTASAVVAFDTDQQLVSRTQVTWLPMTTAAVLTDGHVEIQWASLGIAPTTTTWINNNGDPVSWVNNFDAFMEWVSQQAALLADGSWNRRQEPGYSTSTLIVGLRAGYTYIIRARAVTQVARSAWCNQVVLVVPDITTTDAAAVAAAVAAAQAAQVAADQAAASAADAGLQVADAIAAADAAAAAASAATAAISSFVSDNILSPVEKNALIIDYESIIAEQPGIQARAVAYAITTELNAYNAAVTALSVYLTTIPTWNNVTVDTPVDGPALRAAFVLVYADRQVVLNKIAEIAGTRAAWASVTGIPYDSIYSNDDATALGFNPTFSAWTGPYPDGWQQWSGVAPTKETVLVEVGQYAVRWDAANAALGMQAQAAWTATPMKAGTFVAGSLDMYLVSRVSGHPGAVVQLFTNAALTTFAQTVVAPASFGVGAWIRVPFTCRVTNATDRIYGIRVYIIASDDVGPSSNVGPFTGTVVFDNFRLAFFDNTIDNKAVTIGSNGTLSGAGGGQVTISGLGFSGDLNATYGADASNFTGHIGAGNLAQKSAFREDANSDGIADGWGQYNNSANVEPAVMSLAEGGGMFGGNAQVITWSNPNTSTKGIFSANNIDYPPGGGVVAGWEPNKTYVVSWYARASGTNVGKPMELEWNTQPATAVALVNPALNNTFQRYAFRITWGSSVEPVGRFYISIVPDSLSSGGLSFSAVQVTKGDVLTEYMEAIEDIRIAAGIAKATADQAAADAAEALSGIGIAVSDNVLAATEKKAIIQDVTVILNEQSGIHDNAISHGITTALTDYTVSITSLTNYLATLVSPVAWNDLSGSTTIVGTTFKQKFVDVYTYRQVVLNAIAAADLATATSALSSAAAAQSNASAAITLATQVNQDVANISSDNVITPSEKSVLYRDWVVIVNERGGIDAQAAGFGITTERQAYTDAYNAMNNYLGTLNSPTQWYDMTGVTNVDGNALRTVFWNVLLTKQALLNRIAYLASLSAVWSSVTQVAVTTGQVVPDAASTIYHAELIGQTTFTNFSGTNFVNPVLLTISVPTQSYPCKLIVRVSYDSITNSGIWGTGTVAYTSVNAGAGGGFFAGPTRSMTNARTSQTIEMNRALAAGLSASISYTVTVPPAATISVWDVQFTVEVIRL